jgi:hypothetical protein
MSDTLPQDLRQIATWVVGSAPQDTLRDAAERLEAERERLAEELSEADAWPEVKYRRQLEEERDRLRSDLAATRRLLREAEPYLREYGPTRAAYALADEIRARLEGVADA